MAVRAEILESVADRILHLPSGDITNIAIDGVDGNNDLSNPFFVETSG